MSIKDIKCELCDMTSTTQQEKEEHKKLEHKEHRSEFHRRGFKLEWIGGQLAKQKNGAFTI